MKSNRILIIFFVLLMMWNGILSMQLFNAKDENKNNENITQISVSGFSTDLSQTFEKVNPSCVTVVSFGSVSSGIVYKSEAGHFYVLCSNHGVNGESSVTVILDNDIRYTGEVIGSDIFSDLSIVKVETDIEVPAVKTGDSDYLKEGEFVLAIGTPSTSEFNNSASFAMVSGKLRTILNSISQEEEKYSYYLSVIQLSMDGQEGYSGSGIFNMEGECNGIITMKSGNQVMAIPINEAKIVADRLISDGEVNKVMFGIKGLYVRDLETYEKSALNINLETVSGLYVSNVQSGSLSQLFGLKMGDVILSVNGQSIADSKDYLSICYSKSEEYIFVVERENETIELKGYPND